jgi:hypothetical protein
MDRVELSGIDYSKITPESYKLLEKYVPEIAPTVLEQAPQKVQQSVRGRGGEQAFEEALNEMRRVGRAGGSDPIARAATERAFSRGQQESQGRSQAILQDMARRGMLDSGATLAAQLQGSSDAQTQAAEMSRQAEAEAYARQLQAMREAGGMGRQMAQDELSLSDRNAGIINDYNERMSTRAQNQANLASQTRNEGSRYNIGAAQDIDNRNVGTRNDFAVQQQGRLDDLAFKTAGFNQSELNRQNELRQKDFLNRRGVEDEQERRRQQAYGHEVDKARGRAGVQGMARDAQQQYAQGNASAIQGATDIFSSGINAYQKQQNIEEDRKLKRDIYGV